MSGQSRRPRLQLHQVSANRQDRDLGLVRQFYVDGEFTIDEYERWVEGILDGSMSAPDQPPSALGHVVSPGVVAELLHEETEQFLEHVEKRIKEWDAE